MDTITQAVDDVLDELFEQPHLPRATYRMQFSPQFTFADALALVDYLKALGISDLYTSPLFKPRSGSTHGYDTVDYNEFNPVLGTEEDFDRLVEALHAHDMGLLLDIVPNHMGVNTENVWWMDVLKHGPSSQYAHYFDIEWQPQNRALDNKVLLPVLGDHYGRVLEAGELEVVYWHGDFYLHYYEHQFPLTPETYGAVLQRAQALIADAETREDWEIMELESVIHSLEFLPPFTLTDPEFLTVRRREQTIIRWRLLGLFDKSELFRTSLEAAIDEFNGVQGEPTTFDALDDLLSRQPYRLSYWRVATDEINYRRFFDINDMAAIRIESPGVFNDTHRLVLRLLAEGSVNGLRIDHPDGLWDPEAYFRRLQEAYLNSTVAHRIGEDTASEALVSERFDNLRQPMPAHKPTEWPLYVVAEKILSETEPLPDSWAVYGTTGYDFMYIANNLFVNENHEDHFDRLYANFIGETIDFHALTDTTKKLVMSQSLTSEIEARSAELSRITERNRRYRGFTRNSLAFGMSEIIAALPVYRTYATSPGDLTERDRHYIEDAARIAKDANPLTPGSIFDFLRDVLLMDNWSNFAEHQRPELREFVMKFQQITGPVMAKSVEDTAFYIYNRLTSLNEVGGHPDRFGITAQTFHEHNLTKDYPYTMLSSSTHDTKRSEDVRARISVLSDFPDIWEARINQWADINIGAKTIINGEQAPSRNDEYLLYQTLIGAYPSASEREGENTMQVFKERIIGYMHKAINEAKTHSNWINPNDAYATAITDFVTHILDDRTFIETFEPFQQRMAFYGYFNSLSQTLLKLTAPGIPDIYQGNELWDFSLVDPDNRRPVNFDLRRDLLERFKTEADDHQASLAVDLVNTLEDGAIKLYVIYQALRLRQRISPTFREGEYIPVEVFGEKSDHVCAFVRKHEDDFVLVIVPRLVGILTDGVPRVPTGEAIWGDTAIAIPPQISGHALTNHYTGVTITPDATVPVGKLLADFPVGLFSNGDALQG